MYKILAIGKMKGGSVYHRLNLLKYSKYQVDFVDQMDIELVRNYDLLYIRQSNVKAATLSMWQSLFGLKIIVDRDDSFIIPKDYPNKHLFKDQEDLKDLLRVADCVTTTTEFLKKELLEYNDNVQVIPNRIPYGKEQFQINPETKEKFMSRKIRVGLIGSFYHHQDWFSIKGWLMTLTRNQWFRENCEFLLCGYDESTKHYWKDLESLGTLIQARKNVTDYISIYNNLDVILCPLKDNHFNRAKSSLRVMESGVSNSLCLLSLLYKEKEDFPDCEHIYINEEKEWFTKTLELCQDKELLWNLKKETGTKAREVLLANTIELRDSLIDFVIHLPKEEITNNFYTIRYSQEQPYEYIPVLNKVKTVEQKSWRFEYNIIINLINDVDNNKQWTGFFSWKFPIKTLLFRKKVEKILDEKYDCINFCRPLGHPYLKFTEKAHPGFMNLFKLICKDLDLPVSEPKNVIYSNFFVLKTPLYKRYVQEVLIPALYLLEGKYWSLANKNAQYKSGLPSDKLKVYTGLEYYNFVTFICERLIGQWIQKNNIKTLNYFK